MIPPIKSLIKIVMVLVVALGVMTPQDTFAAKKGGKGNGKPKKEPRAPIDSPNVTQVSRDRITVGSRSYEVTKYTEVRVNGVIGTISDVKVGMEGSVTAGMTRTEAARIDVRASNDKAPEKEEKTGKKKAKKK